MSSSNSSFSIRAWGVYLRSMRESDTTVTELSAIARPAYSGLKTRPSGWSRPAASGMSMVL